jgi:O-acetyl-ADP-ribose deacetylase (regulator of RNase III)
LRKALGFSWPSSGGEEMSAAFWTNPSVLALGTEADPVKAISAKARALVLNALELGWQGPPFDPFALAELLKINTVPTSNVRDARTVPLGRNRYRIEFNPDRPRRRVRYSLFHEIAHTLFPDCAEMIRNRGIHTATRSDDWQLEMLCNVAAAEFLLPIGALGGVHNLKPSVDAVLDLRERYEASAEAALLRIRRLTTDPALAFACHRNNTNGRYTIEYATPTASTKWSLRPGSQLPAGTAATECTAIGFTAKQTERWPQFGEVRVECVGIAPLPHDVYPRVIGFLRPSEPQTVTGPSITYIRGDATAPRGSGPKLLLQVVNDSAITWGGGGFALAVKRRWPSAQREFTSAVTSNKNQLRLGNLVVYDVEEDVTLVSIVAQHGYGPSPHPRIRYGALKSCLEDVTQIATKRDASVHMPRIGTGLAGGAWPVVEEIVGDTLLQSGISVTVYDVPHGKERSKAQGDFVFAT